MNVEVRQAGKPEQSRIEVLLNEYLAELSQHHEICEGAASAAEYQYLKDYWLDNNRFPFTLYVNCELAGFPCIRRIEEEQAATFQVAEFFIKPEYRRRGIGRATVVNIWQKFHGQWELEAMNRNDSALQFWKQCVSQQAESWTVEEIVRSDGRRQLFHFKIAK